MSTDNPKDAWVSLIVGTVGSHAYGLATPESDVDTLSVAAAPTAQFHGLHLPVGKAASRVTSDPDTVVHEAGKFVALCLKANPTVTELLWLPDACYATVHPLGHELINLRVSLLGANHVRSAYFGYAVAQFKRLKTRAGESFSSDVRGRTEKHARHLLRLVEGGTQLYTTGHLDVRLADPERYREFGRVVATNPNHGIQLAEQTLALHSAALESARSPLPEHPDPALVEDWLQRVRNYFYEGMS